MKVCVFEVPYHGGRRSVGMGRGPERLLEAGLLELLETDGHAVSHRTIERGEGDPPNEVGATFALNRRLAAGVREAMSRDELPVVLAGNCSSAHGTLAGLGREGLAVVWLDAHGDFNTPETTASGFFDGMALAALVGRCWTALARGLGVPRVVEENVVLADARDLDPPERAALATSGVHRLSVPPGGSLADALRPALEALVPCAGAYLHVDVDVLDPAAAPTNEFPAPGGVTPEDLVQAIATVRQRVPIRATAFTAYDPGCDPEGRALEAALRAIRAVVADA